MTEVNSPATAPATSWATTILKAYKAFFDALFGTASSVSTLKSKAQIVLLALLAIGLVGVAVWRFAPTPAPAPKYATSDELEQAQEALNGKIAAAGAALHGDVIKTVRNIAPSNQDFAAMQAKLKELGDRLAALETKKLAPVSSNSYRQRR